MKTCRVCKSEMNADMFNKDKSRKDGLANKCKPCGKAYYSQYYAANQEMILEKRRAARKANRDEINTKAKQYRDKNREKFRGQQREASRRWKQRNPDKNRVYTQTRRARLMDAIDEAYAAPMIEELVKFYGKPCVYPGCANKDATLDHVVPLVKGGKHTYWNTQPLCFSHNARKRDYHSDDHRIGHNDYGILMDRVIV